MGYVSLNGLAASPFGIRALAAKAKTKTTTLSTVATAVKSKLVKPAVVPTAAVAAPTPALAKWRAIAGRGQQAVKEKAVAPFIPAERTKLWVKQAEAVALKQKNVVGGPTISPILSIDQPVKTYTPGGVEVQNAQVSVQAGADANRSIPPDQYVATGKVLTITEPTPTAAVAFVTPPETPTLTEPETGSTVATPVAESGIGPVLGIGLGLLALGWFFGRKKGGRRR